MRRKQSYEPDDAHFAADAYKANGRADVAWHILGWETEPTEDTHWDGIEVRTGRVVAVMVGDDRRFIFDEEDLEPIDREKYCGSCGQIGCGHG